LWARKPVKKEKRALDWAFLAVLVTTLAAPSFTKEPSTIYWINAAVLGISYAISYSAPFPLFDQGDAQQEEQEGPEWLSWAFKALDFGSGQERGLRGEARKTFFEKSTKRDSDDDGGDEGQQRGGGGKVQANGDVSASKAATAKQSSAAGVLKYHKSSENGEDVPPLFPTPDSTSASVLPSPTSFGQWPDSSLALAMTAALLPFAPIPSPVSMRATAADMAPTATMATSTTNDFLLSTSSLPSPASPDSLLQGNPFLNVPGLQRFKGEQQREGESLYEQYGGEEQAQKELESLTEQQKREMEAKALAEEFDESYKQPDRKLPLPALALYACVGGAVLWYQLKLGPQEADSMEKKMSGSAAYKAYQRERGFFERSRSGDLKLGD